ncbi:MAG: tRNA preQ1(34) S-adenosylmethionine ribosyltransferase-isomerase QueA [Rickettsiales bacterium]|nr:tRNA preQ1(34) S-adenosylmethionine ribosyltransferase-isomerase QueA [Rickettsiales bacterium]
MFKTSDFNFTLPDELIAHKPFFPKEETKMLVYKNGEILDQKIINLIDFLKEGDVLVFNDAKVIKAKLSAKILRNQAKLEFNLDQEDNGVWQALCRPAKKVIIGDELEIADDFSAKVLKKTDDGFIKIKFNYSGNELFAMLEKYGDIPLPPYIKREEKNKEDQINYQTIYAANGVAVAAPTAGLHFTDKIFDLLEKKGVKKAFVTLNVGAGTFLPVRADEIKDHKMHEEFFSISEKTAKIINEAKKNGKRIIAVGTTSLRALESTADDNGNLEAKNTKTKIFIYPGYKFKIVDILMTNFHLPKSTLFMLICAFVGKEKASLIYNHAISKKYRFYSYGDSSLLFRS